MFVNSSIVIKYSCEVCIVHRASLLKKATELCFVATSNSQDSINVVFLFHSFWTQCKDLKKTEHMININFISALLFSTKTE